MFRIGAVSTARVHKRQNSLGLNSQFFEGNTSRVAKMGDVWLSRATISYRVGNGGDTLKGLSHEIDFKNFDKNLQNLA